MKRYADWCRKQGSQAHCSPGLVLIGAAVVLAGVLYYYRHIVLMTLIGIGITIGAVAVIAVAVFLGRRYYEVRMERAEEAALPSLATPELAQDAVPGGRLLQDPAMLAEADKLADDNVGLAFQPDGETLEVTWLGVRSKEKK